MSIASSTVRSPSSLVSSSTDRSSGSSDLVPLRRDKIPQVGLPILVRGGGAFKIADT